jgi:hypothetical protein
MAWLRSGYPYETLWESALPTFRPWSLLVWRRSRARRVFLSEPDTARVGSVRQIQRSYRHFVTSTLSLSTSCRPSPLILRSSYQLQPTVARFGSRGDTIAHQTAVAREPFDA